MNITLGLGCDRGTPLDTLLEAIELAIKQAVNDASKVAPPKDVVVLGAASIDLKKDEKCMQQLMDLTGLDIIFYNAEKLAQVKVPNPSEVVRKYTGTPSVSEAAALLSAGYINSRQDDEYSPAPIKALIVEKYKVRGEDGRNATVSIALCK